MPDPLADKFRLSEKQVAALSEAQRIGPLPYVNRAVRELQGRSYLDRRLRITALGSAVLAAATTPGVSP
jgi:hypothetical protein